MPPEGEPGGEQPPAEPEDDVPDDIKERVYVIQYAAFFSSDTKPFNVTTDMTVTFKPEIDPGQEINFTLNENEKTINLSHKFRVVAGWRGWLVGSKIISFDQLLSSFDYKSITFKAVIK